MEVDNIHEKIMKLKIVRFEHSLHFSNSEDMPVSQRLSSIDQP